MGVISEIYGFTIYGLRIQRIMKNYITYFLIIFLSNNSHQRQIQKTTIDRKYFPRKIQYDDYSQFTRLFTDIIPMRNGLPAINLIQRIFFNKPSTVQKTLASKNSKIDGTEEKHYKKMKELGKSLTKLENEVLGTR